MALTEESKELGRERDRRYREAHREKRRASDRKRKQALSESRREVVRAINRDYANSLRGMQTRSLYYERSMYRQYEHQLEALLSGTKED